MDPPNNPTKNENQQAIQTPGPAKVKLENLEKIDKEYKKETKEKAAWDNKSFSTGQIYEPEISTQKRSNNGMQTVFEDSITTKESNKDNKNLKATNYQTDQNCR